MIGVPPTAIAGVSEALGWAVVHFLWQGTLIGLACTGLLALLRGADPRLRYGVACAGLGGCLLVFVFTFVALVRGETPVLPGGAMVASAGAIGGAGTAMSAPHAGAEGLLQVVAIAWGAGVVLFGVRMLVQVLGASRLRSRGVETPDARWVGVFAELREQIGVAPSVRLLRSAGAEAPMVVGWLAPVVLVPAGAFSSLSPDQLRAVLSHELSHIRRLDHWVNAVQSLVETLLFFHPVVWWLSSRVRVEREHCCDDAAVRAAGSPRVFAEALARLESLRLTHPQAAVAATGGPLMKRISRILGTESARASDGPRWQSLAALAAGVLIGAGALAQATGNALSSDGPMVDVLRQAVSSGEMTPEQARTVYDATVFPGSEMQREMEAKLETVGRELREAMHEGIITEKEADEKLVHVRADMDQHRAMAFSMGVLGMDKREAYLTTTRARLDRLVASGEMTRQEAAEKLEAIEREAELHEVREQRLRRVEEKLHHEVEQGNLTEEQAKEKLHVIREDMTARMRHAKMRDAIKAAVEAGDLTEDEAREKLEAMERKIEFHQRAIDTRIDWETITRRIEGAVERGEMTREEADRAYIAIKKGTGEDHANVDMWEALAKHLVEHGVAREHVREVLGTIGAIVSQIHDEGDAFELDESHRSALVEAGLDAEQIELVVRMSRRVARAHDREANEHAAEALHREHWEDVREKIEHAVETGRLTREEADAKYREIRAARAKKLQREER